MGMCRRRHVSYLLEIRWPSSHSPSNMTPNIAEHEKFIFAINILPGDTVTCKRQPVEGGEISPKCHEWHRAWSFRFDGKQHVSVERQKCQSQKTKQHRRENHGPPALGLRAHSIQCSLLFSFLFLFSFTTRSTFTSPSDRRASSASNEQFTSRPRRSTTNIPLVYCSEQTRREERRKERKKSLTCQKRASKR